MINYIYSAVFILVVCVFGYTYKLHQDNKILQTNQTTLQNAIDEQYQVILKNKKDLEELQSINDGYKTLTDSTSKRISELTDIFSKEKKSTVVIDNKEITVRKQRDIGELAIEKPKMIETRINSGTIAAFNCFEKITAKDLKGAPLETVCK